MFEQDPKYAIRPTLRHWQGSVITTNPRSFVGEEERMEALEDDRQEFGVPSMVCRDTYRSIVATSCGFVTTATAMLLVQELKDDGVSLT